MRSATAQIAAEHGKEEIREHCSIDLPFIDKLLDG
jgi:hypothetical protein